MKSLEASLVPLHEGQMERNVIEAYMLTTGMYACFALKLCLEVPVRCPSFLLACRFLIAGGSEVDKLRLSALYKVERRGEPERMEKFRSSPNHRLLWHGSPNVNILGILSQVFMLFSFFFPLASSSCSRYYSVWHGKLVDLVGEGAGCLAGCCFFVLFELELFCM